VGQQAVVVVATPGKSVNNFKVLLDPNLTIKNKKAGDASK
jgi:hypothetical protein